MANVLEAVVSGVRAISTLEETSQHQQDNQPQNDTAINVEAVLATKSPHEPPDVR